MEISRAIPSLSYTARSQSFVSLNLRISRTVVVSHVLEIHRQISECGYGSDFTTFSGIRLRDICHRREISPTGLPHSYISPWRDIATQGWPWARVYRLIHPTLRRRFPLDGGECATGPGYKNVIVLHAHARLRLRRTRESTRPIGDRNIDERLPSRT